MYWLCIFSWVICIWVIFFNGAEKLEGTVLGYFEFGQFADEAKYIRLAAWVSLIITGALMLFGY
jgi:hypothetical protein